MYGRSRKLGQLGVRIALGVLVAALAACGAPEQMDVPSGSAGDDAPNPAALSPGIEITHLKKGSGPYPKASDTVRVHYHGTFQDGRVFDSSVERGTPATFPLRRVIPCWTEGVQQIQVGGKAKLVCPPSVAYGARGAPPTIPPNATLNFEVELLGIQ